MTANSLPHVQPQLSDNIKDRLMDVLFRDTEYSTAEGAFYGVMERVEAVDEDLRSEIELAFLSIFDALQRAFWLDGWQCGQHPEQLILNGNVA